ncbi:uncharacterized protein LOC117108808 isoform X2 [Anneissia japonica]|uniref:uncharacterized protein LOC117108808 isoform X2 n=1 Tax=Anneissia japonica TaxID=1529436 RepID=UPI001425BA1A|nr:uncharacterized protein LOC117108808 isoform X2 [Anneissia japonica]
MEKIGLALPSNNQETPSSMVDVKEEESSLPEVIKSVSDAQKTQAFKIANHQEQLKIVQEELIQESAELSKLISEKDSRVRKILQIEDKLSNIEKNCVHLQEKIFAASACNLQLIQEKETYVDEEIRTEKLRSNYRSKMAAYKEQCENQEMMSVTNQALDETKHSIRMLMDERQILEANPERTRLLLEGTCKQNLREQIQELEVKSINLKANIDRNLKKIENCEGQKSKLKQDISVWHKRNVAQMTRLKKQVLEAQTYNRQWNEQACQLERSIASLRQQLEE